MGWQGFTESNNDFYFPKRHATCHEMQHSIPQEAAAMTGPAQGADELYRCRTMTYINRLFIWGFIVTVSL